MNARPTLQEIKFPEANLGPEAERVSRLPQFVGQVTDAAKVLSELSVGVLTNGSVGMRVSTHLARMSVGKLLLADPKAFKRESLLTHEIGPEAIGQSKAIVTAQRCKAISPQTKVLAFDGPAEALEWSTLADLDLIVMAPDQLSAEVGIGQRCLHLGKPLVHAGVDGPTLVAQVRVIANRDGHGPCPACSFGPAETKALDRQTRFSCAGANGSGTPERIEGQPTMSVSSLCSMAADLTVNQILRFALGLGQSVADTLIEYCGFTNRMVTSVLARRAECRCDHTPWLLLPRSEPLSRSSLRELVHAFGLGAGDETTLIEVGGSTWVEFGACQCEQLAPVRRFMQRDHDDAGRCPKCRAPIRPLGFYSHRAVTPAQLGASFERPLRELGLCAVPWVLVRAHQSWSLIYESSRSERSTFNSPSAPAFAIGRSALNVECSLFPPQPAAATPSRP